MALSIVALSGFPDVERSHNTRVETVVVPHRSAKEVLARPDAITRGGSTKAEP